MREAVKLQMLELTVETNWRNSSQSEAETNAHSSESEQDPPPTKKTKPGKVSPSFQT